MHAHRSAAIFRTAGCRAHAAGRDGKAATPDDGQHRENVAGIADAELVHLRSEISRALPGYVRDHGGTRLTAQINIVVTGHPPMSSPGLTGRSSNRCRTMSSVGI